MRQNDIAKMSSSQPKGILQLQKLYNGQNYGHCVYTMNLRRQERSPITSRHGASAQENSSWKTL